MRTAHVHKCWDVDGRIRVLQHCYIDREIHVGRRGDVEAMERGVCVQCCLTEACPRLMVIVGEEASGWIVRAYSSILIRRKR